MRIFSLLLILVLLLSGCSGEQCIEADDFGFSNFTISARYKDTLEREEEGIQSSPWVDTGFVINGRPLVMVVKTWEHGIESNNKGQLSAWCSWFGTKDHTNKLSETCSRLAVCKFDRDTMCTPGKFAKIINAPCIFKNGVGLYGLVSREDVNPNASMDSRRNPDGITFHLGVPPVGYKLYDTGRNGALRSANGLIRNFTLDEKKEYGEANLYFKILDNFYDDNSGQYKIVIKSGIYDTSDPDPITYITNIIKENFFGDKVGHGLVHNIYVQLTQNTEYKMFITTMLTLFVMVTSLAFTTGNLNVSQNTFVSILFKASIVSMLLSSYSWSFFYDYLYFIFVDGVTWMLELIKDVTHTGSGSSSIVGLMIAPQTFCKLFSLLFADWRGFIYIILYFIALYYIVMIIFYASILYLTAVIIIGMIIIMGPIFLSFMLFEPLRAWFDNWLKQLTSYAFQPIILFTGIGFISMLIRDEIYKSLGFRICKKGFPNLGDAGSVFNDAASKLLDEDIDFGNSIFYWWFPDPKKFSKMKELIPVPIDHFQDPNDTNSTYCQAYECIKERFFELPYLDPVIDIDKINAFFSGQFVQFDSLLLLFVCAYLLDKFNSMSISIAKFISGGAGSVSLSKAATGAYSPIAQKIDQQVSKINPLSKDNAANKFVRGKINYAMDTLENKFDNYMKGRLANEALSSRASSTVLDEVRKKHGMDIRDLNLKAESEYKQALLAKIKNVQPGISDLDAQKELKKLLSKNYNELGDEYKNNQLKLLNAQKGEVDRFKEAYVNAHQDLAKNGIGLFGRNIKAFREYKEFTNKVNENKKIRAEERRLTGEAIMSGINKVPNTALRAVLGDELTSRLPIEYTGRAYHDINVTDKRLRTYNEVLHDRDIAKNNILLQRKIDEETVKAQVDVLNPEYLAKLRNQSEYDKFYKMNALRQVNDQDLTNVIARLDNISSNALNNAQTPAEQASVQQLRDVTDKLKNIRDSGQSISAEQLKGVTDEIKNIRDSGDQNISVDQLKNVTNDLKNIGDRTNKTLASESVLDNKLDLYKNLEKAQISQEVYESLTSGKEPVLMGDKFIKEKATDSQLQEMIDKIEQVKDDTLNKDHYLLKEDKYEATYELSKEKIVNYTNELKRQYSLSSVSSEEIIPLLRQYQQDNNIIGDMAMKQEQEVIQSMTEFEQSRQVLDQMSERKTEIAKEYNKYVNELNKVRKDNNMVEYKVPSEVSTRKFSTIDKVINN